MINDIKEEFKNLGTEKSDLRKFAWVMVVAFSLIGGFLFWKSAPSAKIFFSLAGFFLLGRFLFLNLLKPIYLVWMGFAFVMGWFVSRIFLSLFFFLVITPMAICAKILGKDLLNKNWNPEKAPSTYWIEKKSENKQENDLEKQF